MKEEENQSPENMDGKSAEPEPELEPEPAPKPVAEPDPEPDPEVVIPIEEIRIGPAGEKRSEEEELRIEKEYFDAIKCALSKPRENYTNFIKCLHLYTIVLFTSTSPISPPRALQTCTKPCLLSSPSFTNGRSS